MDKIREFMCSRFLTNILLILLFVAVVFGVLELIQVKLMIILGQYIMDWLESGTTTNVILIVWFCFYLFKDHLDATRLVEGINSLKMKLDKMIEKN